MTSKEIVTAPRLALHYEPGCRCPSCGGKGWHVGRIAAECMGCGLALPFANRADTASRMILTIGRTEPGRKGVTRAC